MTGMVQNSPGPDTRLKRPRRSTTTRSHCWATWQQPMASSAARAATTMTSNVTRPTVSQPMPSTAASTATNSTAENSSTPVEDARSPTTSVAASGATRNRRSPEDFSLRDI